MRPPLSLPCCRKQADGKLIQWKPQVPPMRALLLAAPLLLAILAGCSDSPAARPVEDVPRLQATSTTGVIRALVVDEAIRPLAGVTVTVRGAQSEPVSAITGDDGFAGFQDLRPSTYVVEATRPGFSPVTQTIAVEAGVDDPPVAKFLLVRETGERPFYVELAIEGFMQCAVGAVGGSANVCFIANYYPCFVQQTAGQACTGNLTSDKSFANLAFLQDYQRAPDLVQVELVWESTQTVSPDLLLRVNIQNSTSFSIDYANRSGGPSPRLVTLNRTIADEYGLGTTHAATLETFTSSATVGATVNQRIQYFVHVFYGYLPPVEWRFTSGEPVPQPPY